MRANVVRARGRAHPPDSHEDRRQLADDPCRAGAVGPARRSPREVEDDLVFPTILLKLRDPRNTAADWADARERLAIGEYTFHSRKTVGTALDPGRPLGDIAEYLGHADPSLTQQVYMSKTVGGARAANALDGLAQPRLNVRGLCRVADPLTHDFRMIPGL